MPFYRFSCRECGFEKQKLMAYEKAKAHEEPCSECSSTIKFAVGKPSAIGKETKDEYRNISSDIDVKDKIKERAHNHFMEHELDRLVAKEGREFATRQGWLNEDGTKKK